jgi:DNA primase
MFPIRSVQGQVIGFGARVLVGGEPRSGGEDSSAKPTAPQPKYLNSPETPLFVKGRELYGLYEARSAVRERGHVLVVEGYMDVVALAQLGFANAVATLGTACTEDHVRKLFRLTDSVVFSFDGDAAGRRAAARALEAALPHATDTRSVRFLFLPTEHDPDSFVRAEGPQAFERCIAGAVPLSRQLVECAREGCDLSSAEGRARFLAQARPLWQALPEGALKRQVLGDIGPPAGLSSDELSASWGDRRPPAPVKAPQRRTLAARRLPAATTTLLDRALWLLITRCELWNALDASAHDLLAEQPAPYGPAFAWLERHLNEHGAESATALQHRMSTEDFGTQGPALVHRLQGLHANEPDVDLQQQLGIVVDRLHLQAIDEELKLIFESGELSPDAAGRARELNRRRAELKQRLTA